MSRALAPPPAWPIPARTGEGARRRQLAEIHAQYPDAAAWYGEKTGLWMAAPSGATRLIQAPTAASLVRRLDEHYRRYLQVPRPAAGRPPRRPTLHGARAGVVVRSMPPPTSRIAVSSEERRHTVERRRGPRAGARTAVPREGRRKVRGAGWGRRIMISLGLMAETA